MHKYILSTIHQHTITIHSDLRHTKNMLQRFTDVTLQEGRIAHAYPHLENGSLKYYLYLCVHMNAAAYRISQPVKSLHTLWQNISCG